MDALFSRPMMVDFLMPESDRDKGENPIVDSLAIASDWTVVSKCALHGLIYVWDLKSTIKNINFQDVKEENKVVEKDVTLLANLKWSDTDNFYMNLGCHKGAHFPGNLMAIKKPNKTFSFPLNNRQRTDLLRR